MALPHGGARDPADILQGMLGEGALRQLPGGGGVAPDPRHALAELQTRPRR